MRVQDARRDLAEASRRLDLALELLHDHVCVCVCVRVSVCVHTQDARRDVAEVSRRLDLALELLGERNERIEQLEEDIEDMRGIFKAQLEEAVNQLQHANVSVGVCTHGHTHVEDMRGILKPQLEEAVNYLQHVNVSGCPCMYVCVCVCVCVCASTPHRPSSPGLGTGNKAQAAVTAANNPQKTARSPMVTDLGKRRNGRQRTASTEGRAKAAEGVQGDEHACVLRRCVPCVWSP